MHALKDQVPLVAAGDGFESRMDEWGDLVVSFETVPAGTDSAPLFKGLPGESCQCPHWGYIFKGKMIVRYEDGEETISAGQAYYMPPGHVPLFVEETEVVEFSPKAEKEATIEAVRQNLERTGAS
jgi:hypothetical protein